MIKWKSAGLLLSQCCVSVLIGCANKATSDKPVYTCIQPPATTQEADRENLVKLAAKLQELPLDGEFQLTFKATAKQSFAELSDKNATLLILLNAINCYLDHGIGRPGQPHRVNEEIAMQLAQLVREMWVTSTTGSRGDSPALTAAELRMLKAIVERS